MFPEWQVSAQHLDVCLMPFSQKKIVKIKFDQLDRKGGVTVRG